MLGPMRDAKHLDDKLLSLIEAGIHPALKVDFFNMP
jgi:hypothetical protein